MFIALLFIFLAFLMLDVELAALMLFGFGVYLMLI